MTYQTGLIEESKNHDERLRICGKSKQNNFHLPAMFLPAIHTRQCQEQTFTDLTTNSFAHVKTIGAVATAVLLS